MSRPFTFAITPPPVAGDLRRWRDDVRGIEEAGIDTVVVADHFTAGWDVEPIVTLTAIAAATTTLRLQTGVLGVDYRHPVLVHRMAATLDIVSEGRLTLGLGAGWLTSDYESAGLPLDPPGRRIARLEEAVQVIKGLFGPEPVNHRGPNYTITNLVGVPEAVQRPHPPIFMGGGSPKVLRLAGREADIVGIVPSLRAGHLGEGAVRDLARASVEEKVSWIRQGMEASGRTLDDVTLEMNHWLVRVTKTTADADALIERTAAANEVPPELLRDSPGVLVGTVAQLVDVLEERRASLGISYIQLDAGMPPRDATALFPLVAALKGR